MKESFDPKQLRAFVMLAETGSFTAVARELFLTQSAISHSLKALEDQMSCLLLDRSGKKITLTPVGEQFLHHAEKILVEMEKASTAMDELKRWGISRLRIGAAETVCQHLLPTVIRQFQKKFPQAFISIETGNTPEILELLEGKQIDLGLALMPKHVEYLEAVPLFADELFFLLSPSHPWAVSGQATLSEIPKQNYIFYKKASYTFRIIEEYFKDERIAVKPAIELGSMDTIRELVKLGVGISIVAPWIVQKELEEKSLVTLPLGKRKLERQWTILHRKDGSLNLLAATFIELCVGDLGTLRM